MTKMSYSERFKNSMVLKAWRIALKNNNKLIIQITTSNSIKRTILKRIIKWLIDLIYVKSVSIKKFKNQLKPI